MPAASSCACLSATPPRPTFFSSRCTHARMLVCCGLLVIVVSLRPPTRPAGQPSANPPTRPPAPPSPQSTFCPSPHAGAVRSARLFSMVMCWPSPPDPLLRSLGHFVGSSSPSKLLYDGVAVLVHRSMWLYPIGSTLGPAQHWEQSALLAVASAAIGAHPPSPSPPVGGPDLWPSRHQSSAYMGMAYIVMARIYGPPDTSRRPI